MDADETENNKNQLRIKEFASNYVWQQEMPFWFLYLAHFRYVKPIHKIASKWYWKKDEQRFALLPCKLWICHWQLGIK